jgi:hypothetical protein
MRFPVEVVACVDPSKVAGVVAAEIAVVNVVGYVPANRFAVNTSNVPPV